MSHYAVIREAGPGWADGGIAAQSDVPDHAAFMNELAGQGVVLCAGPLAGTEDGRVRVLLIMEANSEREIRDRLAEDPWVRASRLVITRIEPWHLMVGAKRLSGPARPGS